MLKRNGVIGIAIACVLTLLLTACSSGGNQAAPPAGGSVAPAAAPAPAPEKVTLRLGTWDSADGVKAHTEIIQKYQATHPNVTINLESVPDNYGQKLLTQIASGTAPDIMQIGDGDVPMYVSKGALLDLTPYLSGPTGLDAGIFFPTVAEVGKVGGKTYLLTKDYSNLAVYYNKKLFDAAKVPYPKDGWTWDDMLSAARVLTRAEGGKLVQWGIDLPGNWIRGFQPFVFQNGGELVAADGKKYVSVLDSKATVDAVQFYVNLYRKDKVAPTPADKDSFKGVDLFGAGKVAMAMTGRWPMQGYEKNPNIALGVVGLPKGPAGRANVLCWAGFGLSAKTTHPKEAWDFLKFMCGPEGAAVWANWALPAVKSVADTSPAITQDPFNKVFLDDLQYVKPFFEARHVYFNQSGGKAIGDALDKLIREGGDVQATLAAAAKQAEKDLAAQ